MSIVNVSLSFVGFASLILFGCFTRFASHSFFHSFHFCRSACSCRFFLSLLLLPLLLLHFVPFDFRGRCSMSLFKWHFIIVRTIRICVYKKMIISTIFHGSIQTLSTRHSCVWPPIYWKKTYVYKLHTSCVSVCNFLVKHLSMGL